MSRKTGLVWNERFMWHDQGRYAGILPAEFPRQQGYHHEHPETKRRLKNLLDVCDMTERLVSIKVEHQRDAVSAVAELIGRVSRPEGR